MKAATVPGNNVAWLWLVASIMPLIASTGPIAGWLGYQHALLFFLPLLIFYGLIPLLDFLIGDAHSDGHEINLREASQDFRFDAALYLAAIVVLLAFAMNVTYLGLSKLAWYEQLALVLSTGVALGFGLTVSHELGHKHFWFKRKLALYLGALSAYGHFSIEHNHGHHREVATPKDSASARMGESIWRFMPREIVGAWTRALATEGARLASKHLRFWHWQNEILQGLMFTVLVYGAIIAIFGWKMLPLLLAIAFWGGFQLTSANYVEHYGLLRQEADGIAEPCQPRHSWNSNHLVSNFVLFHLQRHSDHHTYAARPYQALRSYANVPTLPSGYFAMFVLAYVPPLWFAVMNPRLLREVGHQAEHVNFHQAKRVGLIQRYRLNQSH